jgi:hypothetical protein
MLLATLTHTTSTSPKSPSPLSPISIESYTILEQVMSAVKEVANLPVPDPRQLPTGDDVRHSKTIIGHLDRTIEDLEQSIRRLQEQLQEAQRKRANYASYISPLRRLPTEILSEIISICIVGGTDILTMCGICSRLREVALGIARIWSNITLRPTHSANRYRLIGRQYGSLEIVSRRPLLSRATFISR